MGIFQKIFGGSESKTVAPSTAGPAYSPTALANLYRKGLETVGPQPTTQLPTADTLERLSGGDFDRFETSLAETPLRRLGEDRAVAEQRLMAGLRTTGMADDPAAQKLLAETVTTPFARGESDILSNAAATRYGFQAEDISRFNQDVTERGALGFQLPRDYYLNRMNLFYQPSGVQKSTGSIQESSSTPGVLAGLSNASNLFKPAGNTFLGR